MFSVQQAVPAVDFLVLGCPSGPFLCDPQFFSDFLGHGADECFANPSDVEGRIFGASHLSRPVKQIEEKLRMRERILAEVYFRL